MHTWNYKMTLLRQKKKLVVFTVTLRTVNFQHKNQCWWSIMRAKKSIPVVWVEINIPTYQPIFFLTWYYTPIFFIWPNVGEKHKCSFKTSGCLFCNISYERGHEKTCLMSYANNKGADQTAHLRSLISAFVVRCFDSIISLDFIAKISRI